MKDCCKSCPTHPCKAERTASQKQMSKGISTFNPDDYKAHQQEDKGLTAGALVVLAFMGGVILLGWAGCSMAHADEIADAKFSTDLAYDYRFYRGDNRPADSKLNELNCLGFAREYRKALQSVGKDGAILTCTLPDGTPHAYVLADGKVLDNRFTTPVRLAEYDCE